MQNRDFVQPDELEIGPLQLFVAGQDSRAHLVEQDVRRVLREEIGAENALEVVDVLLHPEKAELQNISRTPSLVYTGRGVQRRLVGAVDQRDAILRMLDSAPLDPHVRADGPERTLADLSPDGIILVDKDGKIITGNQAGLTMLGLHGKPLRGQVFGLPLTGGYSQSITLGSGQRVDVQVTATNWQGKPVQLATLRPQPDVPLVLADVFDTETEENIDYFAAENVALQSTVDQAARAIEAMNLTAAELERSNQDLSAFAYRAAHDIISPLKSVRNAISMALEDEEERLSCDGKELLNAAIDSAGRVITLTDALMEFSRTSNANVKLTDVNLNTVLRWVQNDLAVQLAEVNAVCRIEDLPTINGVSAHLYQVFLNLVANSIKYRRQDVPLKIDVFAEQCLTDADAPAVLVHVQDNGSGFDQKFADRIFRPFERLETTNEVSGSGIGLATVSRIVSLLGGSVSAKGEVGNGARFTMRFPV